MKKIKDIYAQWRAKAQERKENVHRMIELKRLKRFRSKYRVPYTHCKNCGAELQGMYCHNCGQFAHDDSQPFWKYIWQYFENVYQFDYKIPATVWQLFRRPGFLTNEFNAGKIVSYMHPLKLNMFILVIFFTIIIFMGEKAVDEQFTQANIPGYVSENLKLDPQYFAGKDTTVFFIGNPHILEDYPDIFTIKKRLSGNHSIRKFRPRDIKDMPDETKEKSNSAIEEGMKKMGKDMRENAIYNYDDEQTGNDTILLSLPAVFLRDRIIVKVDASFHKVTPEKRYTIIDSDNTIKRSYFDELFSLSKSWLPLVILLTIPFMAFILKVIYRKKKMNYMSHFVFSLHFCSAMFITLFILLLLLAYASFIPSDILIKGYAAFQLGYFIIASHAVYSGTGWIKSALKSIFVLFIYFLSIAILLSLLLALFIIKTAGV
ncbi:MAG: DUF3667 domain-containing protein [Bacteroidales bacterium]|nr:DUF3667 domain-containing protein [Bacteroidales bacterium]